MNNHDISELYTDYLLTSFSYTTATGLCDLLDGQVSHDQVTRFLASEDFDSKKLWQTVKKDIREIEDKSGGGVIFDDTIQEKAYSKLVKKPILYCDVKTRKVKRKSEVTKNEQLRDMLSACLKNRNRSRGGVRSI